MVAIVCLIIILVALAIFMGYACSQCEDTQGILVFGLITVVLLLAANLVGVMAIIYKVGGM